MELINQELANSGFSSRVAFDDLFDCQEMKSTHYSKNLRDLLQQPYEDIPAEEISGPLWRRWTLMILLQSRW